MEKNDLISRSDAINAVSNLMPSLTTPDGAGSNDNEIISAQEMCFCALQALHELPTMDAVPVVHGKWLNFYGDFSTAECNKCTETFEVSTDEEPKEEYFNAFKQFYKFCPNCGAKMDAPANE